MWFVIAVGYSDLGELILLLDIAGDTLDIMIRFPGYIKRLIMIVVRSLNIILEWFSIRKLTAFSLMKYTQKRLNSNECAKLVDVIIQ